MTKKQVQEKTETNAKETPTEKPIVEAVEETKTEAPKIEAPKEERDNVPIAKSDNKGRPQHGRRDRNARDVFDKEAWKPKTSLGLKVKDGEITDIDYILDNGYRILEPEIVDVLLKKSETDLLLIGQSKGKFGGGQRRVFRQTQKKTMEGNKPKFATLAVIGNHDGYFGVGFGKAKETVPAREKAFRKSKLNIRKISRGCGSWECNCGNPHSIPFKIHGKCGSVELTLMPAPIGTGLCVEKECAKILALAGIKDVWSRTKGKTKTKLNLIKACIEALDSLIKTRLTSAQKKEMCVVEGKITVQAQDEAEFIDSMDVEDSEKLKQPEESKQSEKKSEK
jgi:small subunit ribosomal protein S5